MATPIRSRLWLVLDLWPIAPYLVLTSVSTPAWADPDLLRPDLLRAACRVSDFLKQLTWNNLIFHSALNLWLYLGYVGICHPAWLIPVILCRVYQWVYGPPYEWA